MDTGVWDRSQMAFKFHPKDAKIDRVVKWEGVGNSDFEIPPGHENWVIGASKVFEYPATIYGYLPHSHLRGLDAKYTAYYPDGTEEVLLDVPGLRLELAGELHLQGAEADSGRNPRRRADDLPSTPRSGTTSRRWNSTPPAPSASAARPPTR